MNIKKSLNYGRMGARLLGGLVGVLALAMLFPTAGKKANAEDLTATVNSGDEGIAVASVTTPDGNSSLGVALTTVGSMSIYPAIEGTTTATSTAKLAIATVNIEKYSVYVSTANGQNTLTPTTSGNENVVNPISGTATIDTMSPNTWGYALTKEVASNQTVFSAVPTTNSTATLTDVVPDASGNDSYNLIFGTAVDLSLPTDTYENEVTVSVVATPVKIVFGGITEMQDMTASICDAAEVGDTKQLIDNRDGKSYWAAKLADGHCWMTQNLALDLSTSTTLTPDDTNISANWTPGYNTEKDTTTNSSNNTDTRSWSYHGGMVVLNKPNSGSYYSSWSDTMPMDYVTDVSGMEPTYVATGTGADLDPIDEANGTYDAHYLIGNYYQFNAATAGTGASATSSGANATGSICPKGWRLPTSTSSGEFQALMTAYGMSGSTVNALSEAPLYFVRGGYVDTGDVGYVGYRGRYWSSTSYSSSNAYRLYFASGSLDPSLYNLRYVGLSVRCVAQ